VLRIDRTPPLGTRVLPDGTPIRLRLPQLRDAAGLRALAAGAGLELSDVEARRVLRFDPRRRVVAVATVWGGAGEHVVGVGAIDCGAATPDLLVTERGGVTRLLDAALRARASATADRAA